MIDSAYGTLYVVATPIGNLDDMVPRAIAVLQSIDHIAAEDTRKSKRLLNHFSIDTPLIAYHDYSDEPRLKQLLSLLAAGKSIALIADAGTPLISDPGYRLVKYARHMGVKVTPIPGACALVAALSAAGLPSDRFIFEGFLPAKTHARQQLLKQLAREPRTVIFYESTHRLLAALKDMKKIFMVLLVFGLMGCATSISKKIDNIQMGMTRAEVISVLGKPSASSLRGEDESLYFTGFGIVAPWEDSRKAGCYVALKEDKVIAYGNVLSEERVSGL